MIHHEDVDICYRIHLDFWVAETLNVLTMEPATVRKIRKRLIADWSLDEDDYAGGLCLGDGEISDALAELFDYGAVTKDNALTLTGLTLRTALRKHMSMTKEERRASIID